MSSGSESDSQEEQRNLKRNAKNTLKRSNKKRKINVGENDSLAVPTSPEPSSNKSFDISPIPSPYTPASDQLEYSFMKSRPSTPQKADYSNVSRERLQEICEEQQAQLFQAEADYQHKQRVLFVTCTSMERKTTEKTNQILLASHKLKASIVTKTEQLSSQKAQIAELKKENVRLTKENRRLESQLGMPASPKRVVKRSPNKKTPPAAKKAPPKAPPKKAIKASVAKGRRPAATKSGPSVAKAANRKKIQVAEEEENEDSNSESGDENESEQSDNEGSQEENEGSQDENESEESEEEIEQQKSKKTHAFNRYNKKRVSKKPDVFQF